MHNGRDQVGRFARGGPPGPGRPRNGVRAALARIVDWDKLAAYVYSVLLDDEAPARDRQWAAEFIADRLEGKPVSTIAMTAHVGAAPRLPANWTTMTPGERTAWLDQLRANALAGAPLALAACAHDDDDQENV